MLPGMGHSYFSTLGFLISERLSVSVLLQPFHRGFLTFFLACARALPGWASGHWPAIGGDHLNYLLEMALSSFSSCVSPF